ncbi:hypothetical protein IAU60_004065 [Kwoniella sp. DSM 27419]
MFERGDVSVGTDWQAVGPFPSGMREHPLMASPLSGFLDPTKDSDADFAFRPLVEDESWPSELGDGGRVGWKTFQMSPQGDLKVSYREIRWDHLRLDHGWAALQYQSILRGSLTVPELHQGNPTNIRIEVIQAVEFALIPRHAQATSGPVIWYNGDVYDFAGTPDGTRDQSSKTSNFARSLTVQPGEYVILLRATYEIRMFGEPGPGVPPTIHIKIKAEVDHAQGATLIQGLGRVPDVIDGWFMGEWMSVPIRLPDAGEEAKVVDVSTSLADAVRVRIPTPVTILSGQTRPVAIHIEQLRRLPSCITSIEIRFTLESQQGIRNITWHPQFQHNSTGQNEGLPPFKITFASPPVGSGLPAQVSHAMIVPPKRLASQDNYEKLSLVILALHGAGVDATQAMWVDAMPDLPGYWAVLPTGHNEWGEDWHGGSMADVWAARDAFEYLMSKVSVSVSSQTLLLGHSNGGQGAWHAAARYPDRIAGLIAASGWMTIQKYVPYTELTSSHFADPALLGILSSALTPYNNDLYLSNLVGIPILVIHGGDDNNVPPGHSRAYANLVSSWAGEQSNNDFKVVELPHKGHWWEGILQSPETLEWIKRLPPRASWDEQRKIGFTLATANPQESGGRAGLRIVELNTPGRLARLDVNARQWRDADPAFPLDLRGTNIKRIEFAPAPLTDTMVYTKQGQKLAETPRPGPVQPPRAYGPMIRLLATTGPMTFVVPPRHINLARRMAHDLYVYHRIDSEIVDDRLGLTRVAEGTIGGGNVVIIGRPEVNVFANWMIKENAIPLTFPTEGVMLLNDMVVYDKGAGITTLYPHPVSTTSLSVLIAGNDAVGLELAARLFPLRTGVPIPDWTIVSPRARWQAAGGFIGAGFWSGDWTYNDSMSWSDR